MKPLITATIPTGKGIKPPFLHSMKHALTFQGEKIGLSIACKKSTL